MNQRLTPVKTKSIFVLGLIAVLAAAALIVGTINSTRAAETGFTNQETEQIQSIIKSYLEDNPGVIVDALQAHQRQQQEAELDRQKEILSENKEAIFNGDNLPVAGNPDGNVTLVEFFDYNCGYCKKALPDMIKLLEEDDELRVVFMEFPILSKASQTAARWAMAANEQGQYLDYHIALMSNSGRMSTEDYVNIGKELGLDIDKLRQDATQNQDIVDRLNKNRELAQDLGIRGTPAFIIGDQISPGYIGLAAMRDAISEARAE